MNRTIKDGLPAAYHLWGMEEITPRIQGVIRGLALKHRHVSEDESTCTFTVEDPRPPCLGFLTSDVVQPGVDEEDTAVEQKTK